MSPAHSALAVRTSPAALAHSEPLGPADVTRAFFARRAPSTVVAYAYDLKTLATWFLQRGLASADLNSFAAWLFTSSPGRLNALLIQWVDEMTTSGLAPFTVNRRLSALRSLVKLGRTLGVINWTLDVQGIRGARGVKDMRGPVSGDIRKLFASAQGSFELALLHLLYSRGLRSVEVRELKAKHVLVEKSELLIRGKGKTGLEPVTVSKPTMDALQALVSRSPPESFVFSLRTPGVAPSQMSIWRIVKRIGARAGVAVRPHGLRHSAITAALDATNGDVRKVQKFSRHVDANVLLTHYDDARTDFGGELTRMLDAAPDGSVGAP